MNGRVLVAGVGNVFFCDDGFGVEVALRMAREPWPDNVTVRDYGIRGLHLAYELLEPLDLVVIADALGRGQPPGTLTLLEPQIDSDVIATTDAHGMDLPNVFGTVRSLGGTLPRVLVVGCEPATVDEGMGLSPPVAEAVPAAIAMIRNVLSTGVPPGPKPKANEELEP